MKIISSIMFKIIFKIKKVFIKLYWHKINSHNNTWLGEIGNIYAIDFIKNNGVVVGNNTYGQINVNYTCGENEKLSIGSNCSIAWQCNFILGGEHDYKRISTFPLFNEQPVKALSKGEIIVEDEVWIGRNSLILSGVKIGRGSIVAAGSVVVHDVPPYSIVGGIPAKVIKYRFSQEIIDKIKNVSIDFNNVSTEQIELLKIHLNEENVDEVVKGLNTF